MTKKVGIGTAPQTNSNDVLETAEIVRASNALVRMTTGIISMVGPICKAEVFSSDELKSLQSHFDAVLNAYSRTYQALMARFAALQACDESDKSRQMNQAKGGL